MQRVVDRYEQVYDRLDARAATEIWPRVDARALARIFARLSQQDLNFDGCVFALSDSTATAQCTGWLTYVARVGSTAPHKEQHAWTIELERAGDAWQIVRVNAK